MMKNLLDFVLFVPSSAYRNNIDVQSPDENDVDFLALAKTLNQPLWTHDKKLKEQEEVRILSTRTIIERLKFP